MKKTSLLVTLLGVLLIATEARGADLELKPDLVITSSCRVSRGTYSLPNADETGKRAAITIRGDNLTIDFAGATLEGTPQTVAPDARHGAGIRVEGRNNTIKNAVVRGYKIGIAAFDAPGIKILSSDLSYNWKQHLASTLAREDESDWMSFHRNEQDEWLRYGAGIYLRRCDGFEVRDVTIKGGQSGLMLMECNKGLVANCDFSFLSAIGLGMYLSSDNRIMHNKIDWCVRGYSHGVYNRGQDSAGILIYEQSHRNVFAYNSVTHGGDGFFLWAGQSTMDTGKGGCNDNLLYGNDFSHAPTNGIEATFSRNRFVNNLIMECWHGVWGGYSYDTQILGNVFAYNAESIAIEHGQNNSIRGNVFYREADAIHVWQNERQDPNWGYPKNRDTRSHGYDVSNNVFSQITRGRNGTSDLGAVLRVKATSDITLGTNEYGPVGTLYDVRGPLTNFKFAGAALRSQVARTQEPAVAQQASPTNWQPASLPSLGTAWDAAHEGRSVVAGSLNGLLPPVMQPSGNLILPYPEGDERYRKRFVTTWNPLKAARPLSVGTESSGHDLMVTPKEALDAAPKPLPGGKNPFLRPGEFRGRRYILVDEWGPYDFRSPVMWPRSATADSIRFEVLGPHGSWSVRTVEGGTLDASAGSVPGYVEFKRGGKSGSRVKIDLVYTGAKTIDYRGVETAAGSKVPFGYTDLSVPIAWDVRFYRWDKTTQDPRTHDAEFRSLIKAKPLAQMKASALDLVPGRIPREIPNDYFATIAEGDFEIEPGDYVLEMTTDDGGRLSLDGKLLVDEWHYQGPTLYSREVRLGGKHHLRVEHFQIDGYWTLKVNIRLRRK
jgi:nitrous oxidase accessory protein NosD